MPLRLFVTVSSWLRVTADGGGTEFVEFVVHCTDITTSEWTVSHRFKHFHQLHSTVVHALSSSVTLSREDEETLRTAFPPKHMRALNETQLSERMDGLDRWIKTLCGSEAVERNMDVRHAVFTFLNVQDHVPSSEDLFARRSVRPPAQLPTCKATEEAMRKPSPIDAPFQNRRPGSAAPPEGYGDYHGNVHTTTAQPISAAAPMPVSVADPAPMPAPPTQQQQQRSQTTTAPAPSAPLLPPAACTEVEPEEEEDENIIPIARPSSAGVVPSTTALHQAEGGHRRRHSSSAADVSQQRNAAAAATQNSGPPKPPRNRSAGQPRPEHRPHTGDAGGASRSTNPFADDDDDAGNSGASGTTAPVLAPVATASAAAGRPPAIRRATVGPTATTHQQHQLQQQQRAAQLHGTYTETRRVGQSGVTAVVPTPATSRYHNLSGAGNTTEAVLARRRQQQELDNYRGPPGEQQRIVHRPPAQNPAQLTVEEQQQQVLQRRQEEERYLQEQQRQAQTHRSPLEQGGGRRAQGSMNRAQSEMGTAANPFPVRTSRYRTQGNTTWQPPNNEAAAQRERQMRLKAGFEHQRSEYRG